MPDHTGGAHPTTSGLDVAAIARCWRSRKATVPKEVLCGARSHRGSPPHDFRAYVDVPVYGARCVTQVQCGWRWKVVDGSVNRPVQIRPVLVPDHLLADDAKDDGCGVVLQLGLQPYSSSYVNPFPHAILTNRTSP